MSKIDTSLSTVFGVEAIPPSAGPVVEYKEPKTPSTDPEDEFDGVRSNIEGLIEKGETALESLTDIAVSEESPRAFEVLNTMISTLSDLSMKLVELEERKVKLKKLRQDAATAVDPESGQPSTVNNSIVFVGTTSELHEQIAKRLMEKK